MAWLRSEQDGPTRDPEAIARALAPLGIALRHWPLGDAPGLAPLLERPELDEADRERVLRGLDQRFQELARSQGYQARDLIVLHPGLAGLGELLQRFDRCHTHADDEVRYIIDGEGSFGFVRSDGAQLELGVEAEDYINVPAGTEHWFRLTSRQRIKAVRYFTTTEGWVPAYTGTPIRIS